MPPWILWRVASRPHNRSHQSLPGINFRLAAGGTGDKRKGPVAIVDQDMAKVALCFGGRIVSMIIATAESIPPFIVEFGTDSATTVVPT